MEAYPFLINKDATGRRLQPPHISERHYDEAWLQELLRKYPEILPVAEIESVFSPLIPIGREVPTQTGAIDNLFISHRGYLILVETKLWRNPEAKRDVVAQAIDYGSSLAKWNYRQLNDSVKEYTKKRENAEMDLVDWVENQLGPVEGGRYFFEESVARNLRLGRFLTLVVGDKIRHSVIEMVNYVNKYPGLATNVALIELQCFWTEEKDNWPLLIVPRIVARTEIIERSVVEVTVAQGEISQIDVRQEKAQPRDTGRKRERLTEGAFWELLREQSPNEYEELRGLVADYEQREGTDISPSESSITVKLDIQGTGRKASLFYVDGKGRLNVWPETIREQLLSAGFSGGIVDSYAGRMKGLMMMPANRTFYSRHITEVDISQFKSVVDTFIQDVQLAKPAEE